MVACCSINMRIFKNLEFLLLLFSIIVFSADGAPEKSIPGFIRSSLDDSTASLNEKPQSGDHYDQRQNGTENYRIHVDGLVLVVAPIEGLLLAGGIPGAGDSGIFGTNPSEHPIVEKPKPDETTDVKPTTIGSEDKPPSGKSSHGPGLRLMSLLSPFLRRMHSQQ